MNGGDFTIEELVKGLHDKPRTNPYADIYRLGKPNKQWSDKEGNHFVYRKDGVETHYLISNDKSGQPKLKVVSSTPTKPTKPTNQRYQIPASRQAQVASAQPAATSTPAGGAKEHKFHGNQFTAHGSDVPVQGPPPKAKSLHFSTETLLAESKNNKPQ